MSKYSALTRNFILTQRSAMLATNSVTNPGYPLGSIVPYDIDQQMRLVIYISFIAEHYRNLNADARGCMLICDPLGVDQPQLYARASALCNFVVVPDDERSVVQTSYEKRFPGAVNYELAHNFTFMRAQVERIRWIGGFGEIGWVSADDFKSAKFDQTAYYGHEIISHMNQDHAAALATMAKAFFSAKELSRPARMLAVDSSGFELEWFEGDARKIERVCFEQPLASPADARTQMISLAQKARSTISYNS